MTSDLKHLPRRDIERLSAYVDHELAQDEQARLEARLESEPRLRQGLAELRGTVGWLRQLPQVEPPRNFTLTPAMAGERRAGSRYPLLQFATAFAALAFLAVVGFDAVVANPVGGAFGAQMAEAPMAQQAAPPEEALMQAEQEQAAEAGPSVADELGALEIDSTAAAPPTLAPTQVPQAEREYAATQPAALAAAPPTANPSAASSPMDSEQFRETNEASGPQGSTQTLLRFTEIALALAVIVLAAATYRRRPIGP
ncbi:MAG: hypothetical protein WBR18_03365 [Anaerolineales bacterium]